MKILEGQQLENPGFFQKKDAEIVAGDAQKADVLDRARAYAKRSAALLSEESSGPVPLLRHAARTEHFADFSLIDPLQILRSFRV